MSPEELLAWLAGQSAEAKRKARQHQDNDYMFAIYCGQAEAYTATAQRVSRLLHPSNKIAPPPRVLVPIPRLGHMIVCTEGGAHPGAHWWLYPESSVGLGPDNHGAACCDDHIPEGWVRPQIAPPVEAGTTHPQLPGDGRTGGEAPPSSPPVVSYVERLSCERCGCQSMHVECG